MSRIKLCYIPEYFFSFESAGVIDADYRGNVGVILFNHNDSDFTSKIKDFFITNSFEFYSTFIVKRGDRIAQLICEKIEMADLVEEDVRTLFFYGFIHLFMFF
jgi:dUTPase